MDKITVISTADIAGGDVVVYGDIVGVAATDALTDELVTLYVSGDTHVFDRNGISFTDGEKVGVDTFGALSTDAGSKMIGYVVNSNGDHVTVFMCQGEDLA